MQIILLPKYIYFYFLLFLPQCKIDMPLSLEILQFFVTFLFHPCSIRCLWCVLKARSICFDRWLFWGRSQSSAWFSALQCKTCDLYFCCETKKPCLFGILRSNYLSSRRYSVEFTKNLHLVWVQCTAAWSQEASVIFGCLLSINTEGFLLRAAP